MPEKTFQPTSNTRGITATTKGRAIENTDSADCIKQFILKTHPQNEGVNLEPAKSTPLAGLMPPKKQAPCQLPAFLPRPPEIPVSLRTESPRLSRPPRSSQWVSWLCD